MSIYAEIQACARDGRLIKLRPVIANESCVRDMYISPLIHQEFYCEPWVNEKWERRCGAVRADLNAFVEGDQMVICLEPREGAESHIAILHPKEQGFWEFRCRNPSPGIRIYGGFADIDTFIALTWAFRRGMGSFFNKKWKRAKADYKAEWRKRFPCYNPITGVDPYDFISTSVDDVRDFQ